MKRLNVGGITFDFGRSHFETYEDGIKREWVMTNGLGGYAGSSIIDVPKRSHHGHLIASLHSPVKRYLILSKLNEWITIGDIDYPLHSTKYKSSETKGYTNLEHFHYDTFPIYTYKIGDVLVNKGLILEREKNSVVVKYEIKAGNKPVSLNLSPCFNFRPHGDNKTKDDHKFDMNTSIDDNGINTLSLVPDSKEKVRIEYRISDGAFKTKTNCYDEENYYDFEFETGMKGIDTHYMPYDHSFTLNPYETKDFYVQCEVVKENETSVYDGHMAAYFNRAYLTHMEYMKNLIATAEANTPLKKRLTLTSDQFISARKSTGLKTVLAGLPWFSDWGRDTMIALGGLTLSTKQFQTAKEILKSFSLYVKNGLLPNVFPDEGLEPMYNSVDASLWYFQAMYQYYEATGDKDFVKELMPTLKDMMEHFIKGTDFSIHMDDDCLIHAGSGLDQVTWMDVRINGVCVTPRHGKPVEINALWYNAIMIMDYFSKEFGLEPNINEMTYLEFSLKVKESFNHKFWNDDTNCLNDVVDGLDPAVRPNQIYAICLPYTMLSKEKAKQVVDTVYEKLYTSYGLRSLSEDHEEYKPIYKGELIKRDFAYHQGTVWGFLLGGFVTAYSKVYSEVSHEELIERFITPTIDHLYDGCIGGYSEIFDAAPPHHQRGCYNQAWSVSETLRALCELDG